jgi:hypothetical protein
MSQRERQASGSVSAVAAAPRAPGEGAGPAPVPRSGTADDASAHALLWEDFYRSASPAQQLELLSLAYRQGILYAHQLPVNNNGARVPAPDAAPGPLHLLPDLLAGRTQGLGSAGPAPVVVHDKALDAGQREAVARALGTPDVCLIQGRPGTGKSRVAAEIILQAAARGERVLLLAPAPAAVDRALEMVAGHEAVCAVRCLGPDEKADELPAPLRGLVFAEKVRALREHSVHRARQARDQAEQCCRRRQKEAVLWPQLLEHAENRERLEEQRAALRTRHARVPEVVQAEADAGETGRAGAPARPFVAALAACTAALARTRARLDAALGQARAGQAESRQTVDTLNTQADALRPLAAARQRRRWWSPRWWRATFQRDVVGRLAALEAQIEAVRANLKAQDEAIRRLGAEGDSAEQAASAERTRLLEAEVEARRGELRDQEEALAHEAGLLQNKWDNLCRELAVPAERPAAPAAEAVQAARTLWQAQAGQDEERCLFARQWAAYLDEAADQVAAHLPGYTNVVAATTSALPADPHFGDAVAASQAFDVLLLEEADQVTESEFLRAARRARRWILIGQPAIDGERAPAARPAPGRGSRAAAGATTGPAALQPGFFERLWQHLHGDPSRLPYAWVQEGDRICCQLRQVAADQRRWVETERVADFPEIELRILTLPRAKPALAEVMFPPAMSIHEAKQYLYRELQELPVQAPGRSLAWAEEPERVVLRLARAALPDAHPVALENGVSEWVGRAPAEMVGDRPAAVWHTCRLEFDRAAGWDKARAEAWVQDHLQIRDLGRTALLEVPHRMAPPLAAVLADLLFDEAFPADGEVTAAVEFIPVPPLARGKIQRDKNKGERRPTPREAAGSLPRAGAGLELDLSAPRQGDRLPAELRAGLPGRGLVNYLEALAVVRRLEELVAAWPGQQPDPGGIAVLALYGAQVELLRRLVQQSARLKKSAVPITVDLPAAFRQREHQAVLLSLTRSHSHRAVSFGDGPQALTLALTRARSRLLLFGDAGTILRRSQWAGALDHLDEAAAAREGQLLTRLVRYLQGQGRHPRAFHQCEGSSA